jgi:hypothetical protein
MITTFAACARSAHAVAGATAFVAAMSVTSRRVPSLTSAIATRSPAGAE